MAAYDPWRITVDVQQLSKTGFEIERMLQDTHMVLPEMAAHKVMLRAGPNPSPVTVETSEAHDMQLHYASRVLVMASGACTSPVEPGNCGLDSGKQRLLAYEGEVQCSS